MGGAVKSVGKSVGSLFGFNFKGMEEAGRRQAEALTKSADQQAKAAKEQAAQSQRQQETALAQRNAADKAAQLLASPVEQADVDLSVQSTDAVDEATGKRLKPRDRYSNASINI